MTSEIGRSWSRLGPDFFQGHGDLTLLFAYILIILKNLCCLVEGEFDFVTRGERHVHRNHVVRVVRLIGVYG